MVLVNAATGAPISAPTANSLSGTMTTQSTNSASLPAGISVQQLLQQAQQQQAAQAQQVQQQVNNCFFILMIIENLGYKKFLSEKQFCQLFHLLLDNVAQCGRKSSLCGTRVT